MATLYVKTKVLLLLALVAGPLAIGALFFLHHPKTDEQTNELSPQVNNNVISFPNTTLLSSIKTQTIELRPSYREDEVPGNVVPVAGKALPVFLPFPAQIVSIDATVGQDVNSGQPIAHIKSPSIALYWGEWLKAKSSVEMAQKDYDRAKSLMASGAKSKKELQVSEMLYMQAKAEQLRTRSQLLAVGVSEDELSNANPDLDNASLTIKAPFQGKIGNISGGVGQNLNDLSKPFITITPAGTNWIEAQLPQSIANSIPQGQTPFASVQGSTCKGNLLNSEPSLDPTSRRRSFYFECNDPHLHVGDFVTVDLKSADQEALLIPKSALIMNNNDVFIFTASDTTHFIKHKVEALYDEGNNVRINSGVNPGNRVVTSGAVIINSYYPQ